MNGKLSKLLKPIFSGSLLVKFFDQYIKLLHIDFSIIITVLTKSYTITENALIFGTTNGESQ